MKIDRTSPETALSTVVFPTRPSLPPPEQEKAKRPLDIPNSVRRHRALFTWTTVIALLLTGAFVAWQRRHHIYRDELRLRIADLSLDAFL